MEATKEILLYDTDCAMCSSFVQSILRFEVNHTLSFASLSGTTAEELYAAHPELRREDTVIVWERKGKLSKVYTRSSAVAKVLQEMGGKYRSAGKVLRAMPRPMRDLVYRGIAANRKRLFGTTEGCVLLPRSQQWRALP